MDSPHIDQWRGALMFPLICAWTNSWANNRGASDLRCHRGHFDVTVTWHLYICPDHRDHDNNCILFVPKFWVEVIHHFTGVFPLTWYRTFQMWTRKNVPNISYENVHWVPMWPPTTNTTTTTTTKLTNMLRQYCSKSIDKSFYLTPMYR